MSDSVALLGTPAACNTASRRKRVRRTAEASIDSGSLARRRDVRMRHDEQGVIL